MITEDTCIRLLGMTLPISPLNVNLAVIVILCVLDVVRGKRYHGGGKRQPDKVL